MIQTTVEHKINGWNTGKGVIIGNLTYDWSMINLILDINYFNVLGMVEIELDNTKSVFCQ